MEFQRFSDDAMLEETVADLEAAGIPFRIGSTAPGTESSWTGTGTVIQVVLSVPASRHAEARRLLEDRHARLPLPDDHHLLTASDDDLIEILSHEEEWSPYDVAHARQLARARNIDEELIRHLAATRLARVREGRQASRLLVIGGILLAVGGTWGLPLLSIMATGIGWSLFSMKDKHPDGSFPTYDEASRRTGKVIFLFGLVTLPVGLLLRWRNWV